MTVDEMLDNLVAYVETLSVTNRQAVVSDVMHSLTKDKKPICLFIADEFEKRLIRSHIIEKQ